MSVPSVKEINCRGMDDLSPSVAADKGRRERNTGTRNTGIIFNKRLFIIHSLALNHGGSNIGVGRIFLDAGGVS
jgi:hypothetical protein